MTLVLIEVPNEAAVEALRRQATIRVVGVVSPTAPLAPMPPRTWAGALPTASAAAWDEHLRQLRGEWEQAIWLIQMPSSTW